MPRKLSPEFRANVGIAHPGQMRGHRGPNGSKAEVGRLLAMELLQDPTYRRELKKRLIAGVAGPVEVYLWRKAFGDPDKDDSERAAEAAKFEQIRTELRQFMLENKDRARTLNAIVTRAPRLLPLPRLAPQPEPVVVEPQKDARGEDEAEG